MTDTNIHLFWDRLEDVKAGMLGAGEARPVPMSHYCDKEAGSLWFITAEGTDLVKAVSQRPHDTDYIVASGGDGLYARIGGTLRLNTDPAKLDEIWNAVASSWFDGGKRDPNVRLLELKLKDAEVWATTKSAIAFLYEVAKAKVTGEEPDMGEHFTLKLAA